jgi:hypothetical protein
MTFVWTQDYIGGWKKNHILKVLYCEVEGVAQGVQQWLCKFEALILNLSPQKKKKKKSGSGRNIIGSFREHRSF